MTASSITTSSFTNKAFSYLDRLQGCFNKTNLEAVENLAKELHQAWIEGRNVYICGNGGSAANAIHIANDLHYGIGACGPGIKLPGLRVEALPANAGVITCLANDTGYENIYAHQLEVKSRKGDLLIALSGSGNSANITKALETANKIGLKTLRFWRSLRKCKELASTVTISKLMICKLPKTLSLLLATSTQWLTTHKPDQIQPLSNG